MTDQQMQAELTQAMAAGAAAKVEELQAQVAAAVGLVVVTLSRDAFFKSLSVHCDVLHNYGNDEIRQIIRAVHDEMNTAVDRLAYIAKEAGK